MGYNKSPLAYSHLRGVLDRALESPKGIRIPCASRGEAILLRSKLNYLRKISRAENREIYPPGHALHGASPYDVLTLTIPPKGATDEGCIFIQPLTADSITIEEIK